MGGVGLPAHVGCEGDTNHHHVLVGCLSTYACLTAPAHYDSLLLATATYLPKVDADDPLFRVLASTLAARAACHCAYVLRPWFPETPQRPSRSLFFISFPSFPFCLSF